MEQIEYSETSANHNQMPGKYPKEYRQENCFQIQGSIGRLDVYNLM